MVFIWVHMHMCIIFSKLWAPCICPQPILCLLFGNAVYSLSFLGTEGTKQGQKPIHSIKWHYKTSVFSSFLKVPILLKKKKGKYFTSSTFHNNQYHNLWPNHSLPLRSGDWNKSPAINSRFTTVYGSVTNNKKLLSKWIKLASTDFLHM